MRHICGIKIWKYGNSDISAISDISYFHIFIAHIWRMKMSKYRIFPFFFNIFMRHMCGIKIWKYENMRYPKYQILGGKAILILEKLEKNRDFRINVEN